MSALQSRGREQSVAATKSGLQHLCPSVSICGLESGAPVVPRKDWRRPRQDPPVLGTQFGWHDDWVNRVSASEFRSIARRLAELGAEGVDFSFFSSAIAQFPAHHRLVEAVSSWLLARSASSARLRAVMSWTVPRKAHDGRRRPHGFANAS